MAVFHGFRRILYCALFAFGVCFVSINSFANCSYVNPGKACVQDTNVACAPGCYCPGGINVSSNQSVSAFASACTHATTGSSVTGGAVRCPSGSPYSPSGAATEIECYDTYSSHTPQFYVETTTDTTEFDFAIQAEGTFYVDCDVNNVGGLTSTERKKKYVNHGDNLQMFVRCKYNSAGQNYKIGIASENVTKYPVVYGNNSDARYTYYYGNVSYASNDASVIKFAMPGDFGQALFIPNTAHIYRISGSLGKVFPTLGTARADQQPAFEGVFANATNLTGTLQQNLFTGDCVYNSSTKTCSSGKGIYGPPSPHMYDGIFSSCTGLTGSIPDYIFGYLYGDIRYDANSQTDVFAYSFNNCTGLSGYLSDTWFKNLELTKLNGVFDRTFYNCTGLTGTIPNNFFGNISNGDIYCGDDNSEDSFGHTFYNTGISGTVPYSLFSGVDGFLANNDNGTLTVDPDYFCTGTDIDNFEIFENSNMATQCANDEYQYLSGLEIMFGNRGVICKKCPNGTFGTGGQNITSCIPNNYFTIKTTNLSAGTEFKFKISAFGSYMVDWGDGETTAVSMGAEQVKDDNSYYFSHTYDTAGVYNIKVYGNTVAYSDEVENAAISFHAGTSTAYNYIEEIIGSIGSVFPTVTLPSGLSNNDFETHPSFYEMCRECTNLTSIGSNLFSGVTGAIDSMFEETFRDCYDLAEIPSGLFSGITGNAPGLFENTFEGCNSIESIPSGLFNGVTGTAENMFKDTFNNCESLQYIPADLFQNVSGTPQAQMFKETFANAANITSFKYSDNSTVSYIPITFFGTLENSNYTTPANSDNWAAKNIFADTQILETCPEDMTEFNSKFKNEYAPKVSCIPDAFVYTITYVLNGGTNYSGAPTNYYAGISTTINGTPTKQNATFVGWCTDVALTDCALTQTISASDTGDKVFYAKFDCTTGYSEANIDTTYTTSSLAYGKHNDSCWLYHGRMTSSILCSSNKVADLGDYEWKASFKNEVIYGQSLCATNNGNLGDVITSDQLQEEGVGACWCNLTGFAPVFNGIQLDTIWQSSDRWVSVGDIGHSCNSCPIWCAHHLLTTNSFKQSMFEGWETSSATYETPEENNTDIVKTYMCKQDIYAITYELDGGTNYENAPTYYYYESETIVFDDPAKQGYTFSGWFTDSTFETQITEIPSGSMGDKTLYAKWTPNTYNITYELNGGTNYENAPTNYTYGVGATINGVPTKENAVFIGWCTDSTLTNCAPAKTISASATGDKVFYAKFACDAGYKTSDIYAIDTLQEVAGFRRWNIYYREDGVLHGGFVGNFYNTDVESAYLTRTGTWMVTDVNNVSIVGNSTCIDQARPDESDADFELTSQGGLYTGPYCWCKLTNIVDENLADTPLDASWVYQNEYSSPINCAQSCTKACTDTVLEALRNYQSITSTFYGSSISGTDSDVCELAVYTITYILDGGTNYENAPTTYTKESNSITFGAPSKPGYVFKGWFIDSGFTTAITGIPHGSTGDKTVYAKWVSESDITNDYDIIYELNGGTNYSDAPTTYTAGTGATINGIPTKDSFEFVGWCSDAGLTDCHDTYIIPSTASGDKTVYAKWNFVCESGKWYHLGEKDEDKICLYAQKKTSPAVAIGVSNAPTHYLLLSSDPDLKINNKSDMKMHITIGNNTYNAYDESVYQ